MGMREGSEESAGGGDLLAVLTGERERDAATLEALREVDAALRTANDPAEALELLAEAPASLVVADATAPGLDPVEFRARLSEAGEPRPRLLALLPAGTEPAAELPHWLVRPFRPETLAALARALLERAPSPEPAAAGEAPTLQVRRPARFSARPLYAQAERFVRETFDAVREAGTPPDMERARVVAERLHTSLLQSNLLLLRALEPYDRFELPTHCVNVAIVAGKIAIGLENPLAGTLRTLQAGLLHDIGMMRLPDRILRKEGRLTAAEREEMQDHPLLGAELVKALGPEYAWLERAVVQEHERLRAQGYPAGLEGDEIDPIARILGVADVFEAFSHSRAYRSPFTSYEALEKVIALRGEQFHPEVVDALTDEISVFPLDSYVLLSSGEIGRVVESNPENLLRPAVEVLWDRTWQPLPEPRRLDLREEPALSIRRPLHEAEVPIT